MPSRFLSFPGDVGAIGKVGECSRPLEGRERKHQRGSNDRMSGGLVYVSNNNFNKCGGLDQWLDRLLYTQKVAGSKPAIVNYFFHALKMKTSLLLRAINPIRMERNFLL